MRNLSLTAIILIFLLRLNNIKAQNKPDDAPVIKTSIDQTWMAGAKAEYYFKENSCFFYSADYNFNEDYDYRITRSTRLYNRLGLESNVSGKWFIGGSLSHRLQYNTFSDVPNIGTVKINITHRGKIGPVQFIKELSGEYIHHFNDPFFEKVKDLQAGLGAALYKDFKVFKKPLGIMLSYKIILNSNLKLTTDTYIYKDRRIDFTRMRFDLFYGISKNLFVGIFAMQETEYFYPIGTSAGTPPVNVYYKENSIKPVAGINLNFVLKPDNCKAYIPGLPFR
jgi:hypothetical protein